MMVTRMGSRVYSHELSLSDTRVTGGSRDGEAVFHSGYCMAARGGGEKVNAEFGDYAGGKTNYGGTRGFKVCNIWSFGEETVTPNGHILDGSADFAHDPSPELASKLLWLVHTNPDIASIFFFVGLHVDARIW